MKSGYLTLTLADRLSAIADLESALTDARHMPTLLEDLDDLNCETLAAAALDADETAAKNPSNFNLRMKALYAFALYRDTRYALATGLHHYTLGYDAAFASLYEGGRLDQITVAK